MGPRPSGHLRSVSHRRRSRATVILIATAGLISDSHRHIPRLVSHPSLSSRVPKTFVDSREKARRRARSFFGPNRGRRVKGREKEGAHSS